MCLCFLVEDEYLEKGSDLLLPKSNSLNGALHWATHTHGGERVIAAFDLLEESFKHVPLPAGLSLSIYIGVLGDCLCLLELHAFSDNREFWVMKEYGVKESLTRVFIQDQYFLMESLCF